MQDAKVVAEIKKNFGRMVIFFGSLVLSGLVYDLFHAGPLWVQVFYLPILLVAHFYGVLGGVTGGVVAGLTSGLIGMLNAPAPASVGYLNLAVQLFFFIGFGWGSGLLVTLRQLQLGKQLEEYKSLADAHIAIYDANELSTQRLKEKNAELDRRMNQFAAVYGLTDLIGATMELDSILNAVLDTAGRLLPCDACVLHLIDEDSRQLVAREARGQKKGWQAGDRQPLDSGIISWVARNGQGVLCTDVAADTRFKATEGENEFCSVLSVPLVIESRVVGVLSLGRMNDHYFTGDDLSLLSHLASQAAFTVHRAQLYRKLEELAITDGLTGLYNRRRFQEAFEHETQRAQRYGNNLSLLMLDLDFFKRFNDANGHPAGDRLLRDFARIISENTRNVDVTARYGGEEFVIILPDSDAKASMVVADRIATAVASRRFEGQESQPGGRVTVSVGLAAYPEHTADPGQLLELADQALYRAKKLGRNQIVVALSEDSPFLRRSGAAEG
ncbi:MAG: diguanylate cyclase [Syntrophothermus sp.]